MSWRARLHDEALRLQSQLDFDDAAREFHPNNALTEGYRAVLEDELRELDELLTAVPVGELDALAQHLHDDARCGGMAKYPVDEYAYGLDCAAEQIDELVKERLK